jgi:ribosomal protein S12 methylthiotransferase
VLVDEVRADGVAVARTAADAPEIDGKVFVRGGSRLQPGDFAEVTIERADAFDLVARLGEATLSRAPVRPIRRLHRVIGRV